MTIEIIRSRRRTISIEVKDDARLIVRAPYHVRENEITGFVEKKGPWIRKARKTVKRQELERPRKTFSDGDDFFYLGKPYRLNIAYGGARALVFNDAFILSPDHRARAKEFFTGWYKEEASRMIRERLELYSSMSGLKYSGIKITGAKRRWGSCARTGRLTFSWRLVMAPREVLDYVIVHELAHLEHMNHSKSFWAKVRSIYPEYEKHKRWLKDHGHKLAF